MPETSKRFHGVVIRAAWMVLVCPALCAASTPVQHPVPLAANTDSSTCLQCHADKNEGKYVHAAMQTGCTTCHSIKNVAGGTQVLLVSPADQLCFTCHEKSTDRVQHQPYAEGACTVCHSPHASNYPAHTWVAQQELCMGCHVMGMPKVNEATRTVSVPWGRSLTLKQIPQWRYLGLNAAHTKNHPVKGHPVSGPNTLLGASAPPITCLSCHRAHVSTRAHLIPPQFTTQEQLCVSCHTTM